MKTARLRFDDESRRWCIGETELHCGDVFELFDDKDQNPVFVRIEYCIECWYFITPYGCCKPSTRLARI